MYRDQSGSYVYYKNMGVGTSEWILTKTNRTIFELIPSVGGNCYMEVTNSSVESINDGTAEPTMWALGVIATKQMDWMYSVRAFRLVVSAGTAQLNVKGVD
jgi:hypothetical protein